MMATLLKVVVVGITTEINPTSSIILGHIPSSLLLAPVSVLQI